MNGEARILSLSQALRNGDAKSRIGAKSRRVSVPEFPKFTPPEHRPLGRHASMKTTLNQLPSAWIQCIAEQGGIQNAPSRMDAIVAIESRWKKTSLLRRFLRRLSTESRRRLVFIQRHGCWVEARHYRRQFPGDLPFKEWDWTRRRPESPLGRLRFTGLVSLGRARVSGQDVGILTIPKELREPLAVLAWDEQSLNEELEIEFLRQKKRRERDRERNIEAPRPWLLSKETLEERTKRFVREADAALRVDKQVHARQLLQAAVECDPHGSSAWLSLGRLELEKDALPSARRLIEKGLRRAIADVPYPWEGEDVGNTPPSILLGYHLMAKLCYAEGRLDQTASHLERILDLDWQDRMEVRFWLPEVLLRYGEHTEAKKRFENAIHPTLPRPWFGLGLAQSCLGQTRDAVLSWRRAILMNEFVPPLLGEISIDQRLGQYGEPSPSALEWAKAYVGEIKDVFEAEPEALSLLLRLWSCGPVAWERRQMLELRQKWRQEKNSDHRAAWHRRIQTSLDPQTLEDGQEVVLRALSRP